MKKWRSAVIGLGQIGMGYDYDRTDDSFIITHSSGFDYHNNFDLVGSMDIDVSKREKFIRKYGVPSFSSIEELMSKKNPQVIAIAVPTTLHYEVYEKVISFKPKAVICEKPIATNGTQAKRMVEEAKSVKCALFVNYFRRFEPGVIKLKGFLKSGELGQIYKGVVWYSKGIINNGSHYIDLLRYLLGEVVDIKVIAPGRSWKEEDPEPDVRIVFGQTEVYFMAGKEEAFSSSEFELVGTKGKIDYRNGGANIQYYNCSNDPIYSDYKILSNEAKIIKSDMNRAQWYVLKDISDCLDNKIDIKSSGETALETLGVVEEIIKQRDGGKA